MKGGDVCVSLYISLELHAQVGDQDLVEAISGALMSVWKIRRFSESRWLTIGSSCRVLIAGLVTGLDNFARFIQRDSAHLNTFLFVSSISIYPHRKDRVFHLSMWLRSSWW